MKKVLGIMAIGVWPAALANAKPALPQAGKINCSLYTRVEVITLGAQFDANKRQLAFELYKYHPTDPTQNFQIKDDLSLFTYEPGHPVVTINEDEDGNITLTGEGSEPGRVAEASYSKAFKISLDASLHLIGVHTKEGTEKTGVEVHNYDVNTGSGQLANCTITPQ